MSKKETKRSKWWPTLINILDGQFPKGECRERGRAIVMLSYIEMMLKGWKFDGDGRPVNNTISETSAGETKFGGKKLKDYSRQELMEILETFIKVDPFKYD